MNTSIIKFDYNGNIIPFEKGSDVMVNLTAMAKAYPDKIYPQLLTRRKSAIIAHHFPN